MQESPHVPPSPSVDAQYGRGNLRERIEGAVVAAGLDPARLGPDDLAALEELHTLGRTATMGLAELAGLTPTTRVLDVGAGLGGPARLLARRFGCRVVAVDLTAEYCEVAAWLNRASGLDDQVEVRQGDALALPVEDASFDVVWTQHVQMNIADKAALYRELRRVAVPGGRLALWDVVAGPDGTGAGVHVPVPWADTPALSHLVAAEGLRRLVEGAGFAVESWQDLTGEGLASFDRPPRAARGGLTLQLVIPDLAAKVANVRRNLAEGRIGLVRGVLRAV